MIVVAVLLGGAAGTALRLAIDAALPHADGQFPLSTLVINSVGSFVLGALISRLWQTATPWLKAGLGPGLLGSFTTFSAVAVGLVSMGTADQWMPALGFLALTVVFGLAAAWLGLALGKPAPTNPEYEE